MSQSKPIKLAILWHMHQPDYRDPDTNILGAPWVRLHAAKDYLDMLEWAVKYDNIKVTFNLVPSLIEQFDHYINGGSDNHLELTRLNPSELNDYQKNEILNEMFKCNYDRMIAPNPRYHSLFQKWDKCKKENKNNEFTPGEILDSQVWSNLVWVDPLYRNTATVKKLFEKQENYSEQDKHELIEWQLNHIKNIISSYKEQLQKDRIEISFSPYFHPILPLLCDSRIAKEALPGISLPQKIYEHPEDARSQIQMSIELFENLFSVKLNGMWPSEGSVSDEAINICAESGIKWLCSDEQVLYRSLHKNEMDTSSGNPYKVFQHSSGIKMLFRDHTLSDKIGFVYSSWEPERAVDDFINHIKSIPGHVNLPAEDIVVPVILDGENCWEFYQNDGSEFLDLFYKKISEDREITTVTISEAISNSETVALKSVFAGSWINNNFKIWIGHSEDNTAWDYLKDARDYLTEFQKNNPDFDSEKIKLCWKHIFIAGGSDWFWWFGEEHFSADKDRFDLMFRKNLIKIYQLLNAVPPGTLSRPIVTKRYKPHVILPDALVTPKIDGKISQFYEWFGAGRFQATGYDSAMHRVSQLVSAILFGFDHEHFYIKLEFLDHQSLRVLANLRIEILFELPEEKRISFNADSVPSELSSDGYACALDEVFELSVDRKFLWTESSGVLAFRVELYDGNQTLEKWPHSGSIECELPEKNNELFWH